VNDGTTALMGSNLRRLGKCIAWLLDAIAVYFAPWKL